MAELFYMYYLLPNLCKVFRTGVHVIHCCSSSNYKFLHASFSGFRKNETVINRKNGFMYFPSLLYFFWASSDNLGLDIEAINNYFGKSKT